MKNSTFKDLNSKNLISLGLRYENKKLLVLDQTALPRHESWIECQSPDEMIALIRRLAVRGAPLIGVAAALALAHFSEAGATPEQVLSAAIRLKDARPTAVNLMAAMDQFIGWQGELDKNYVVAKAIEIFETDVYLCEKMANAGEHLIEDGDGILTHCNTGGLATAGIGTALGVIRRAYEKGKKIHVYVDETRPLLQGARLTAWELKQLGIPHTLICDNMAGILMQRKAVKKVFVGADRIALNGDCANKVGTYSLAVMAKFHSIPFYVVAPTTTFDKNCPTGADIPIEMRAGEEILRDWSPIGTTVYNPAFDVTPKHLITEIILDNQDNHFEI